MKHFLNCLFQRQERIANIEFRPTEYVGDTRDSKTAIFDVLVIGDRGEQYLVEMQLANQECFKDRAYFYDSRMFTDQLPRGNAHKFCDIKETQFIGIQDFILQDSPKGDYVSDISPSYW